MSEQLDNPLNGVQDAAGAEWLSYGDVPIVATFGEYEAEYAAIHRHVAILHQPQRGILRLTGPEEQRRDFLHRMMTQDIRSMTPGSTCRTLQLNDKGRIVADAIVHHGNADTWLELDACDAPALKALLEGRIFVEEIAIEDVSLQTSASSVESRTKVSVLGPAAGALFEKLSLAHHDHGTHHVLQLAGVPVTVYRRDDASVMGVHLLVRTTDSHHVYKALLDAAGYEAIEQPDADYAERRRGSLRGRPIGWLAYNTARIEAGQGLFHVDFGPDSLPHEMGPAAFGEAVHLKKGCYLGQEIVARMQNLGHPKKLLVCVKFADDRMPVAGSEVFDAVDRATSGGAVIGAITSSAVSPVLGNCAIGLAVMKWGRHVAGTKVLAPAEGEMVAGEVVAGFG